MFRQELTLFDTQEITTPQKKATVKAPSSRLTKNQFTALDSALSAMFPAQDESQIQKIRRHLGEVGNELTDEQVQEMASKFQYLIDVWLDSFERQTFQGKTLQEVLGGK